VGNGEYESLNTVFKKKEGGKIINMATTSADISRLEKLLNAMSNRLEGLENTVEDIKGTVDNIHKQAEASQTSMTTFFKSVETSPSGKSTVAALEEKVYQAVFLIFILNPTVEHELLSAVAKKLLPMEADRIQYPVIAQVRKKLVEIKRRFNTRCKTAFATQGLLKEAIAKTKEDKENGNSDDDDPTDHAFDCLSAL